MQIAATEVGEKESADGIWMVSTYICDTCLNKIASENEHEEV